MSYYPSQDFMPSWADDADAVYTEELVPPQVVPDPSRPVRAPKAPNHASFVCQSGYRCPSLKDPSIKCYGSHQSAGGKPLVPAFRRQQQQHVQKAPRAEQPLHQAPRAEQPPQQAPRAQQPPQMPRIQPPPQAPRAQPPQQAPRAQQPPQMLCSPQQLMHMFGMMNMGMVPQPSVRIEEIEERSVRPTGRMRRNPGGGN